MQKIKTFYRSFLFRIGSIIFFLLGGTLTAYSILIHFKSIDVARQNIHLIINAHAQEISEAAARYGSSYAADLVDAISDENTDTRLYLLFNNAQLKTGSLAKWPALIKRKDGFYEALILSEKKHLPVHLLIQKIVYPDRFAKKSLYAGFIRKFSTGINHCVMRELSHHLGFSKTFTRF